MDSEDKQKLYKYICETPYLSFRSTLLIQFNDYQPAEVLRTLEELKGEHRIEEYLDNGSIKYRKKDNLFQY